MHRPMAVSIEVSVAKDSAGSPGLSNSNRLTNSAARCFFSQPIFVSHNEEWPATSAFNGTEARAFENHAGLVHLDGGEIQLAATTASYADLSNCWSQGSTTSPHDARCSTAVLR